MNGYTYINVTGQDTINLNATSNSLTINASGGINLTTNPVTNTLTINTDATFTVNDLVVTNTLNLTPSNLGSLDNVVIGNITPRQGTFTTLTALSTVTMNPANANIILSPTGTGTVIINPGTTGTIDNSEIGSILPAAATFTNVTITSLQQTDPASAVTKSYATALSVAYGVAMS